MDKNKPSSQNVSIGSGTDSQPDLLKLSAHLQSLITSLDDLVFEIDGVGTFKNVWVYDESKLFMPREAFLGKRIEDVMGPMAGLFSDTVQSVIETGEVGEIVYRHLDPAINQWFRARIKPVVKSLDLKEYVLVFSIQDITKQRIAEIVLQETKARLELSNQLLDVSQELSQTAGWEFNIQAQEVFWTKQVYALFDEDERFQPTFESIRQFFVAEDVDFMESTVANGKSFDFEIKVQTAKGVRKWVRSIGEPVTRGDEVMGVRGALMDITLNKENEFKIIEAKNLAESASKAKSDFLSIMSHEIRTPLNGIIGIANLLKLNHTIDQKEYVSNLIFSADHLLELINDILDLNKMENDKLELIVVEINLARLVRNIKNQFKSLAEAKGIRLVSFVDDDIPVNIMADPVRLGQILNNLISNAIKFTENGEVTLFLKLMSIEDHKATINFRVKDTGIGIPTELQQSVFESFKQVQQSPYRSASGTGLGLTITQKLAELHKSKVFLSSESGVGSEFYFDIRFDMADDQSKVSQDTIPLAVSDRKNRLKGLRVLLVEDNPINVLVARKQLEFFGADLDCVYSGREGMAMLRENTYHVAMLDLHMPEIDGYALAEIVRKEYMDTHVVIFTADIMQEVKVRLAKMQVYDILSKPFAPEKMFDMLLKVGLAKNVVGG
jgi:signal transduction histidine kinase/ActR/RegA family two-component response regulator